MCDEFAPNFAPFPHVWWLVVHYGQVGVDLIQKSGGYLIAANKMFPRRLPGCCRTLQLVGGATSFISLSGEGSLASLVWPIPASQSHPHHEGTVVSIWCIIGFYLDVPQPAN